MYPELDNPVGVASSSALAPFQAVVLALAAVGIIGSAVSLIKRFKAARGDERLQLKWLALAGVIAGITVLLGTTAGYALLGDESTNLLIMASIIGLPVATGIAITRYRLYDVDLVINRALVYGSLTAVLAVLYIGGVLLLQLVFERSDRWLRTGSGRIHLGDRRTRPPRPHQDPGCRRPPILPKPIRRGAHGRDLPAKVRDGVDLSEVSADLLSAVHSSVRPSHVSISAPLSPRLRFSETERRRLTCRRRPTRCAGAVLRSET